MLSANDGTMNILQILTYYRPHISGLTIYVERLSKAFAKQGHSVTVLTSQYDKNLPLVEATEGVVIQRVPVAFRVSKGVIMPSFGPTAWRMVRWADIIHLHLPQFDAPGVAIRGRLYSKPVVLTYHSDLRLPDGLFNRIVDKVVHIMNRSAGELADAVVTYTYDFGSHSPYLSRYLGKKLYVIPPPVQLASIDEDEVSQFKNCHHLEGKRVIGISARLAAEKGIEVLLEALPIILEEYPDTVVLHASPEAIGENSYAQRIAPLIEQQKEHYQLLGALHGSELTAFYRNLDCLVMCSLNNTETFGLVQIEAMMNNVPSVASDLPGVRQPVTMTGMGEVTPIGNPIALAAAIKRVFANPANYEGDSELITQTFNPENTANEYMRLFDRLMEGTANGETREPISYEKLRRSRKDISRLESSR
jgi:glycosyltransferase involved in cell wall biosynthesis